MIFLTRPAINYKESFLDGLREFQQEGRMLHYDFAAVQNDFASFVYHLCSLNEHMSLPPDHVPSVDYWLIDADEFVGRLSLRLELNAFLLKVGGHIGYQVRPSRRGRGYGKQQLRLGLQKAREHGLTRVLVTCDEDNLASKKVIEYNGGVLENAVLVEGSPVLKLRYWVNVSDTIV